MGRNYIILALDQVMFSRMHAREYLSSIKSTLSLIKKMLNST